MNDIEMPFEARARYMRLAMERWGLVKRSINLAKKECLRQGQLPKEHFKRFVKDGLEDYRFTRYGDLLIEEILYRRVDIEDLVTIP